MSTESKKYGVKCDGLDFGLLNARNQLIRQAINPALDTLLATPIFEHVVDSETRYSLQILLVSEREIADGVSDATH